MRMNRLLRRMFERRGITDEMLIAWDTVESEHLLDVDAAVEALHSIRARGDKIVVLPDFDMDGITSCVVGVAGLAELGFDVTYYVPDPTRGYGFDAWDVERLLAQVPDCKAIISCDTGIGCQEGVLAAVKAGIEIIITDHHPEDESESVVGIADVVVNPRRIDDPYSNKAICGAHVFWQVLAAFAERYENAFMRDQIDRLRLFAGIGTVTDSMDLYYSNRQLVRDSVSIARVLWSNGDPWFVESLDAVSPVYKRAFQGMYALLSALSDAGKITKSSDITEELWGFYVGPMFNAVKRLDGDMSRAYGAFLGTHSPAEYVTYLFEMNEQRKAVVSEQYNLMMTGNQPLAPYAYIVDTYPGVCGLLASKVMNETGIPTMVLNKGSEGAYHGSARSPEWYPIRSRAAWLPGMRFAGHECACGVNAVSYDVLAQGIAWLHSDCLQVQQTLEVGEAPFDILISTYGDGDTDIDIDLLSEFLHELHRYGPFGKGFPRPNCLIEFDASEAGWFRIGNDKSHLKVRLSHGFDVLVWNQGSLLDAGTPQGKIRIAGDLQFNEFMDRVSVQFSGREVLMCAEVA